MTESAWHHWHHNEGPTLLRGGRAHLIGRERGFPGYPDGQGQGRRRDVDLGCEWRALRWSNFGFGLSVKVGTNGSEHQLAASVYLGPLAAFWVNASGVVPYRWLERHKPDGSVDYQSRVTEAHVYLDPGNHPVLSWKLWAPRDGYPRADRRWWRESYVNLYRWALGKTEHTCLVEQEGTVVIPMPEANYPATFKVEHRTNRHVSRLGRLWDAVMGPQQWRTTEITPGKPVPVPGKGENSWDCDDDAIHSISVSGTDVQKAVSQLVGSALSSRARHGGQHMNAPTSAA